jgi:hypothetical protein
MDRGPGCRGPGSSGDLNKESQSRGVPSGSIKVHAALNLSDWHRTYNFHARSSKRLGRTRTSAPLFVRETRKTVA